MNEIKTVLAKQREFFRSGATRETSFRLEQLRVLEKAIRENENEILKALREDLHKTPFEAYATEVGFVLEELKHTLKNLAKWTKPQKVRTPFFQFPASSHIYPEPYGSVLIISPWNYPFHLTLAPLIGSIAAGNCSILKPSELSPNTSAVIAKIISKYFDESYIAVFLGGRDVSEAILEEQVDYIFFTGSEAVGKLVMRAAAEHLTPVTLELGGKSPCIVDREVKPDLAARRIVWGKFLNAGQTCVAPDYLLVHREVKKELLNHIEKYISRFFGEDPEKSSDFPRIINERHFRRLLKLMDRGQVVSGGRYNEAGLYIAPTVIDAITWDDPIMQEEIFGPLLPVLEYNSLSEAVTMVNSRPKPLALYFFSTNKRNQDFVLNNTSFGGGCINDTIMHLATPYLPFGGVGESGMGRYHGKASFEAFSNKKSILKRSSLVDIQLRYPPYKNKLRLLKKILG